MSFHSPWVLIALAAIPALVAWYLLEQRGRRRAAAAFVTSPLMPSVAPRRPRWRRHVPMLAFLLAIALLILAAARPQRSVAVPVGNATIVLATDVSSSMAATDVSPSRLGAALSAAKTFVRHVPGTVKIGALEFARHVTVLQTPTADHASVIDALNTKVRTSGGTAIGDALKTAQTLITTLPAVNGKKPPGAILLLSDGYSNVGSDPLAVARQAKAAHIPIYTVELGTTHGTIVGRLNGKTTTIPVPISPAQLRQIASISGGESFTVTDAGQLKQIYTKLGNRLSHRQAKHEITEGFAGGGLALLLIGGVLSLLWFGRLI